VETRNQYIYVYNNPYRYWDPTGMAATDEGPALRAEHPIGQAGLNVDEIFGAGTQDALERARGDTSSFLMTMTAVGKLGGAITVLDELAIEGGALLKGAGAVAEVAEGARAPKAGTAVEEGVEGLSAGVIESGVAVPSQ
jgi:hypothetical protein